MLCMFLATQQVLIGVERAEERTARRRREASTGKGARRD